MGIHLSTSQIILFLIGWVISGSIIKLYRKRKESNRIKKMIASKLDEAVKEGLIESYEIKGL